MTSVAVIYAAKSTKDINLSIPEQLDDCREMCEKKGWEVVGEFKDEGFTAFTGNRGPGLAAAIKLAMETAAQTGEQVFIVAQHTSRFARGDGARPGAPKALVELFHEWARANVRGRLVENDKAMESSRDAANQGDADNEFSRRLSNSVTKGLRRRARDRKRLAGGPRPYGYEWGPQYKEWDEAIGKEQLVRDLVVVPSEAEVVRRVFAETTAGVSQKAIARAADEGRHPVRPGPRVDPGDRREGPL